ncbi:MAG: enoyl-CoA hydratase/isomerase family protein [Deltaproteobacteria bacterium]|nr:enoyl-CoA hydratase/isomerase family protein [Deltaproteobacteria bacterium]
MKTRTFKTLVLEVDKQFAMLKFNRPDFRNAYTDEMGLELLEALNDLAAPSVRSVVLTGAGADFSIGFDPVAMKEHIDEAPMLFRKATGYLHQIIAELRRLPKPVIGAINGPAAGTGFSFALACDFILASETATFSSNYINLGLSPDGGLTYFLTRLVGPQKCAELVMTGKTIGARKALDLGVISGVVPPDKLLEEAKSLAVYFANGPTLALGRAKRLIDTALSHSLEEQLEEERQSIIEIATSSDFKEGLSAYVNKMGKPNFGGN